MQRVRSQKKGDIQRKKGTPDKTLYVTHERAEMSLPRREDETTAR